MFEPLTDLERSWLVPVSRARQLRSLEPEGVVGVRREGVTELVGGATVGREVVLPTLEGPLRLIVLDAGGRV